MKIQKMRIYDACAHPEFRGDFSNKTILFKFCMFFFEIFRQMLNVPVK
jgi:hypothetical protein